MFIGQFVLSQMWRYKFTAINFGSDCCRLGSTAALFLVEQWVLDIGQRMSLDNERAQME